jgi:hypothetical protein
MCVPSQGTHVHPQAMDVHERPLRHRDEERLWVTLKGYGGWGQSRAEGIPQMGLGLRGDW